MQARETGAQHQGTSLRGVISSRTEASGKGDSELSGRVQQRFVELFQRLLSAPENKNSAQSSAHNATDASLMALLDANSIDAAPVPEATFKEEPYSEERQTEQGSDVESERKDAPFKAEATVIAAPLVIKSQPEAPADVAIENEGEKFTSHAKSTTPKPESTLAQMSNSTPAGEQLEQISQQATKSAQIKPLADSGTNSLASAPVLTESGAPGKQEDPSKVANTVKSPYIEAESGRTDAVLSQGTPKSAAESIEQSVVPRPAADKTTQVNPVVSAFSQLATQNLGGVNSENVGPKGPAGDAANKVAGLNGLNSEIATKLAEKVSRNAKAQLSEASQSAFIEKIQQLLEQAKQGRDGNTLVFRIDPPELGKMTVKVTQRGDELYARIIPESAEVEHTLRSRLGEIAGVLQSSGLKVSEVHVSIGDRATESESAYNGFLLADQHGKGREHSPEGEAQTNREELAGTMNAPQDSKLTRSESASRGNTPWVA